MLLTGSSVVTSLCASEAVEKKVAILEVTHEKKFKVDIHKLKTVRPFIIEVSLYYLLSLLPLLLFTILVAVVIIVISTDVVIEFNDNLSGINFPLSLLNLF